MYRAAAGSIPIRPMLAPTTAFAAATHLYVTFAIDLFCGSFFRIGFIIRRKQTCTPKCILYIMKRKLRCTFKSLSNADDTWSGYCVYILIKYTYYYYYYYGFQRIEHLNEYIYRSMAAVWLAPKEHVIIILGRYIK